MKNEKKKNDSTILDEIDNIMSSGDDVRLNSWQMTSLEDLFEPLSRKQKRKEFKKYAKNIVEQEGWEIDEVTFISELCEVKNVKLKISFD